MGDDTRFAFQQLNAAAYVLAEEIWRGDWDHIASLKKKPVGDCQEIIAELEVRCPGFSLPEYARAIANGMHDSR